MQRNRAVLARPSVTDKPLVSLDDPAMFAGEAMRTALAARDVTLVYRLLYEGGVAQREIARRTGQSQSEVSDILRGRKVRDVTVLERIVDGRGIPRAWMRLAGVAGSEDGAYGEEGTVADPPEEVIAEMFRRHLPGAGCDRRGGRCCGGRVGRVARPGAGAVAVSARLHPCRAGAGLDPSARRDRQHLRRRPGGAQRAAAWAEQLLGVPGAEPVRRALKVAVGERHIEAGWAGFDTGHYHRAVQHFMAALELATEARDAYLQATALHFAGMATVEHGHPDDGLKMIQFSLVKVWDIPRDEQRSVVVSNIGRAAVEAGARADAATALAHLGFLDAADVEVAKSRQMWLPTRADRYGDLDRSAALLALRGGTAGRRGTVCCSVGAPLGGDQPEQSHALQHRVGHHPCPGWGSRRSLVGPPCHHCRAQARLGTGSASGSYCWPTRWRPGPAPTPKTCPEWPTRSPQSKPDPQPEAESSTASQRPP
ncbi:MAG: hypothetical protein ACRDUV_21515 [Pseudonocardiaceae bacterium]